MRGMYGRVAVLYDDRADVLGEFDRDRALAIPTLFRPALQDISLLRRCSGSCSGRNVGVAIFVLQAVAAGVGEAQAVAIHARGPEVVEHIFVAVKVDDALDETAGGGALDNGADVCVGDVEDAINCGVWTVRERITWFGDGWFASRLLGSRRGGRLLSL